jgi:MFS family permease
MDAITAAHDGVGPTLVLEHEASVTVAAQAVSAMSWVFPFALPLGGWLSTRYGAADMVMIVGLVGSVIFGLAIPFVGFPALTFALFGTAFAIATPAIASLPAEILRPDNRASGFGIYYICTTPAPRCCRLLLGCSRTPPAPRPPPCCCRRQ